MRTYFGCLIVILFLLVIVRCRSDENVNGDIDNEGAVTEIGVPLGPPITADIGSSGGVITSADQVLTVTVPPGAVATNTTFSIEPIEDFCPGGMGSYRLLPEGMTFTKPVTITFHYSEEDLEGTLSEFLDIAYQGPDQIWYALSWVVLDEQSKTISVDVPHFTNWSMASKLRIEPHNPAIPIIEKGATYNLHLAGAKYVRKPVPADAPGEDDLPRLPIPLHFPYTATWYVNGVTNGNNNVGTISTINETYVTYHAPDNVPANNPVLVTAELTGFEAWDRVKNEFVKFNKVICMKRIKIKPDEYNFTLEVNFDFENACGLQGVLYHDVVTMDVQVKEIEGRASVFFYNILNEDATTKPLSVKMGDCTASCRTGGEGIINVIHASGEASIDQDRLVVTLSHTGTSNAAINVTCPGSGGQSSTVAFPDYQWQFTFNLSDENEQTVKRAPYFTAKLSPK